MIGPQLSPDNSFREELLQDLPQLMAEMTQVLESSPPQAEFYSEFLQRLLGATKALGGAVWERTSTGQFQLQYHIHFEGLDLDETAEGSKHHVEILQTAARRDRPLWVSARSGSKVANGSPALSNPTPYGLLLAPIVIDKTFVGLVEIWVDGRVEPAHKRVLARFLAEWTGFAGAYHHRNQWQSLIHQQQTWVRLEAFARQIHGTLDPDEVSKLVAYEVRQQLECDQAAVALRTGGRLDVAAVSGVPSVERRARLVQLMRKLFDAALAWGEKLVYRGQHDDSLPPKVSTALDHYLAESNSKLLIIVPLRDAREEDTRLPCSAALMIEAFEPALTPEQLEQRLEIVASHATSALYNAVQHRLMPLRGLSRFLARCQDRFRGRRLVKFAFAVALVVSLIFVFGFLHVPLRLEAKGQLLPRQRQIVFAPIAGKVIDLKTQHGEAVEKGQELLFIEDLDTQLQVDQLTLKITAAEKRLALLSDQLGKTNNNEERHTLTRERIQQEFELRKAVVERDILLQHSRTPRKSPVSAPLSGKVVTFDAHEQLVGKTVKPGDPLLRIARAKGPWEIELHIPEGSIAAIREALTKTSEGFIEVDFMLASHPQRKYHGRLSRDGLGGETTVKDNQVVLPARVQIADIDLIAQLEQLPVGVDVRAKVNCGQRALGYVWFHDLLEFFYERLVF